MSERTLRVRRVLSAYATAVVVVLFVAAGVGGVLAYEAHVDPGTEVVERRVDEWRLDGSFQHGARVTADANGTPFEPNATVENREVYFERIMPVLEGDFVLAYDGDDPVALHVDRRFVVESVVADRRNDEATVLWRRNRSLGATETTLQPGGRTTQAFAVNVSDATREAHNVSERLGSPGEIRTRLVVVVRAEPADDAARNRTHSFVLPVEPEGEIYRVGDGTRTVTFNRTESRTVAADPGPIRSAGGPVLLAIGLVGLFGLVVARRRDVLSLASSERAWLAYCEDRADYAEWITDARLPADALDGPTIVVDSLEGLADVAIDAGERVVHDTASETYVVLHDDRRFVYQPPPDPTDAATTAPLDADTGTDPDDLPFGDDAAQDPDAVLADGDRNPETIVDDEATTDADGEATTDADDEATTDADGEVAADASGER